MLRPITVSAAILCLSSLSQSYVSVPWQTQRFYGFDGPWQALSVAISDIGADDQQTQLDLMPGSTYSLFAVTESYCQHPTDSVSLLNPSDTTNPCTGTTWDVQISASANVTSCNIGPPTVELGTVPGGTEISGSLVPQSLYINNSNIGGSAPMSVAAVNSGSIKMANGSNAPLAVGFFPTGFAARYHNCSSKPLNATSTDFWSPSGILYNDSQTESDSSGLHIGSVAYGYTGSLILGGYDQGRGIGPATNYGTSPPTLLDIVIGVEVGGSPFSFQQKAGLLTDVNGNSSPTPVNIDPQLPYLYLSQQTCSNLEKVLPIHYDSSSGYYLWDNSSADYQSIVSSSAYLGFVFPAPSGGNGNVTIKVPFGLLNLTLTAPAVPEPVLYFPCIAHGPDFGNAFNLGRAFMQSAYLIQNHNKQINWLAQAAGPGPVGQGLFNSSWPVNLDPLLDTVMLYDEETLFASSWAQYWQPLPSDTVSVPLHKDNEATKIGVGVGVSLGTLLLLACAVIFFLNRRRKQPSTYTNVQHAPNTTEEWAKATTTSNIGSELHAPYYKASELDAHAHPSELVADRGVELDALAEMGSGKSPRAGMPMHGLSSDDHISHHQGQ